MSDAALIEHFADALWMERGLSRNTLAAYQSDLNKASAWLRSNAGRGLREAHREDLLAYLGDLGMQGRSARSTARLLSSLRQFYQWLVREGMTTQDPSAQIEMPKQGRPLPKSLTEEEVENLLAAPDLSSPEGFRDRTMFELLYATGLRVSELVTLRPDQVSLTQGIVRVTGKGGKERLVPLGEEAADWLQRFVRGAREDLLKGQACEALFPTRRGNGMTRQAFWYRIKKHAAVAGIRQLRAAGVDFGAHGARHIRLADVDLETARKEIGQQLSPRKDHGLDGGVSPVSLEVSRYASQIDVYREAWETGRLHLTTLEELQQAPEQHNSGLKLGLLFGCMKRTER